MSILKKYINEVAISKEGIFDSIKSLFGTKKDKLAKMKHDELLASLKSHSNLVSKYKTSQVVSKQYKTSKYGRALQKGNEWVTDENGITAYLNETSDILKRSIDIIKLYQSSIDVGLSAYKKYKPSDITDNEADVIFDEVKKHFKSNIDKTCANIVFNKSDTSNFDTHWFKTSTGTGYRSKPMLGNEIVLVRNSAEYELFDDLLDARLSKTIEETNINTLSHSGKVIASFLNLVKNIEVINKDYEQRCKQLENLYHQIDKMPVDEEGVSSWVLEEFRRMTHEGLNFYTTLDNVMRSTIHLAKYIIDSLDIPQKEVVAIESIDDAVLSLEADEEQVKSDTNESSETTSENNSEEKQNDETTDNESPDESQTDDQADSTETPPEEDTGSNGEDDTESDQTTSEETSEDEERRDERRETRREEVRLDNPEDEKVKISSYLEPLLGDQISELTLFSAAEINRPLYHVSMNPSIERFTPQVSKRTLGKEDRSVPRISTSTSLIGCLNGYQSMVSDMEGRAAKNFNGLFKVYELPYQYAVKPSRKLLSDVENSDEYWLVSWKKETYATYPIQIADFTIPKIEKVFGADGKDETFHVYIKVTNGTLYIDHQRKLEKGYYHMTMKGYTFKYPLKNNNLITIENITENEYNKVTALSMMIKKR